MTAHINQAMALLNHRIDKFKEASKGADDEYKTIAQIEELDLAFFEVQQLLKHMVGEIDLNESQYAAKQIDHIIDDISIADQAHDVKYIYDNVIEEKEGSCNMFEEHSTWGMGFDRHNQNKG
jgi:hypothetical protein